MMYICTEDLQGGSWGIDREGGLEYWREVAIEWATSDCDDELVDLIQKCSDFSLIATVSEIWGITIKPTNFINALKDIVLFEEETSTCYPWALSSDEILKMCKEIEKESKGYTNTDTLLAAIEKVCGVNPDLLMPKTNKED